ncbi:hypothetical protein J2S78_002999 [Salibacterium salarium]|uniref:SdpI/YhfL protein family protein n=1 Tax=Salibacterium salarium TaxID=284579 RepID=A0A3R9P0L7_9BACI|nr:hypothetical protein [Salibacterium salarium]MDQ0300531.1 hypothetical protein [Salibacterium salarium]RSL30267.1 hypothetical protein D7Z54_27075 [Salibacterium salarium]
MTVTMWFIYIVMGLTILAAHWIYHTIAKVKNEEYGKVDSGKAIIYYRLSYRRRMHRSLWTLPFGIVILVGLYFVPGMTMNAILSLTAIFVICSIIEIGYTYIKWKKTSTASEQ